MRGIYIPDDKKKKKVTRIMKITMDADEFEKFDKGEMHSDKGVRNDRGKPSVLSDISPVFEDDLPKRMVVRTQKVYIHYRGTNTCRTSAAFG